MYNWGYIERISLKFLCVDKPSLPQMAMCEAIWPHI
jgi:hypothetical protein